MVKALSVVVWRQGKLVAAWQTHTGTENVRDLTFQSVGNLKVSKSWGGFPMRSPNPCNFETPRCFRDNIPPCP